MVKLNRMVLTQGFGFILLPVLAVALTKIYGASPEETEKQLVSAEMAGKRRCVTRLSTPRWKTIAAIVLL